MIRKGADTAANKTRYDIRRLSRLFNVRRHMSHPYRAFLRFGSLVVLPWLPRTQAIWSIRCFTLVTIACVTTFPSAGCMSSTSPHENFLRALHMAVGRDIRTHPRFSAFQRTDLPNGNSEYRLSRRILAGTQPCTDIYEVDPKTYQVLRADFEGSPQDCVIPP